MIAFYVVAFAAGGFIQPFLNPYLIEVGLTGTQVGLLHSWAALVTVLITPLLGLFADRAQRHRLVLAAAAFAKGIAAPLMLLSSAWIWLASIVTVRVISAGVHDAILNRLTLARLAETGKQDLGAVRFWGVLSFAASAILAGTLANGRSAAVLFPLAGLFAVPPLLLVKAFPSQICPNRPARLARDFPSYSRPLLSLFLVIFCSTIALSGAETFMSVFLSTEFGAGNELIGWVAGVANLAPLPAYVLADRLVRRWNSANVMAFSFLLSALAWLGYALIPQPQLALPLAAVTGSAHALNVICLVYLMGELGVPARAATDQMLAQLTIPGLARIIAQPASGWVMDVWGGRVLFAVDAALLLSTVVLCVALFQWPRRTARGRALSQSVDNRPRLLGEDRG